jgi:hypothetical protein
MADLIPLDEKLGEVLGLAQAAQAATSMYEQAAETTWAVEVQHEHVETVRRASLTLAVQEITETADG